MEQTLESEFLTRVINHKITVLKLYVYHQEIKNYEKDTGFKIPDEQVDAQMQSVSEALVRHYAVNLTVDEFNRRYKIAWEQEKENFH